MFLIADTIWAVGVQQAFIPSDDTTLSLRLITLGSSVTSSSSSSALYSPSNPAAHPGPREDKNKKTKELKSDESIFQSDSVITLLR